MSPVSKENLSLIYEHSRTTFSTIACRWNIWKNINYSCSWVLQKPLWIFRLLCRGTRWIQYCLSSSKKGFSQITSSAQNTGVLAQFVYVFPERFQNDLIPLYMYANELNRLLLFMKVHIDTHENEPPIVVLNSVLEGKYSRKNFAIFWDNIDYDMRKFHSYPKTRDMWRTESECNV